jgi:hypothetical protein
MGAPDKKVIELEAPSFLKRKQPARFGWWSDGTLMIVKGDQEMTLDADDLRDLSRFVDGCNLESQL